MNRYSIFNKYFASSFNAFTRFLFFLSIGAEKNIPFI